jgi:6-phosphogluconolactonase (cycloisomerase 2 family)
MKEKEKVRQVRWSVTLAILVALLGAILITRSRDLLKAASSLNLVYVESNIGLPANSNSVFGFSNVGGTLSPVAGSPWLTGGTGVHDPGQVMGLTEFDADQQVIISPQNNLLFAVNGHSNSFAVFTISSTDGHLTAIAGSPFHSNGSDPVSFALLYNILSGPESWLGVVNKGADPNQRDSAPNVSTFKVTSAGVPTLVSQGTVTLGSGSSPSQLITATGSPAKHQFWAFLDQYQAASPNEPGLYSYQVLGNAGLKAVNSAADPANPPTLGLALNRSYRVMYAGLPTLNEVAVFTYDSTTGKVTFSNAVANPGMGVGWLAVGPTSTGQFLYTSEPGSGTITVYSISSNGTKLTQVQHSSLMGMSPVPGNLAFDSTGAYLYCLDSYHALLHVLSVNAATGKLSEPNSPTALNVSAGNEPLGLATIQY